MPTRGNLVSQYQGKIMETITSNTGATVILASATEPKTITPVTVNKGIAKTPKAKGKGASRGVAKGAQAPKGAKEVQAAIKYCIVDYARPKAGHALFAHTAAFLRLSGMDAGQAYPIAKAREVVGATAVKYHSSKGNFEPTAKGLALTAKGKAFFAARGEVSPELLAAFTEVLTTGKPNDKANVKSEASRKALA